jgi:hypothetical protein
VEGCSRAPVMKANAGELGQQRRPVAFTGLEGSSVEKKKDGEGVWFTASSGGKKRGPVPRVLERGEGHGAAGLGGGGRWAGRQGWARGGGTWGPVWHAPVGWPRKKGEQAWGDRKKWAQP